MPHSPLHTSISLEADLVDVLITWSKMRACCWQALWILSSEGTRVVVNLGPLSLRVFSEHLENDILFVSYKNFDTSNNQHHALSVHKHNYKRNYVCLLKRFWYALQYRCLLKLLTEAQTEWPSYARSLISLSEAKRRLHHLKKSFGLPLNPFQWSCFGWDTIFIFIWLSRCYDWLNCNIWTPTSLPPGTASHAKLCPTKTSSFSKSSTTKLRLNLPDKMNPSSFFRYRLFATVAPLKPPNFPIGQNGWKHCNCNICTPARLPPSTASHAKLCCTTTTLFSKLSTTKLRLN